MPFIDARTARVLATIVAFGLGLGFVVLAWRTLVIFLFAILFAYLLEPLVVRLQQRFRLSRSRAIAALYALLLAAVGLFVFFVSPTVAHQASRLAQQIPSLTSKVANGQIARELGNQRGWSLSTQLYIQHFLVDHREQILRVEGEITAELEQLAANLEWIALMPILAIFFLRSGSAFADAVIEQLSRRHQRMFVEGLLSDLHEVLANYIRAQLALTALAALVYLVGFEVMRLPYAIALAAVAGLLEFIPVVGPLLGAVIVIGATFLLGYPHLLAVMVFLGIWRVIQDYLNSPRIMGRHVRLHPLAVLFGVFAGAEIAGVIGVYLSVPAIASLRVVWRRWRAYQNAQNIIPPTGIGMVPPAA